MTETFIKEFHFSNTELLDDIFNMFKQNIEDEKVVRPGRLGLDSLNKRKKDCNQTNLFKLSEDFVQPFFTEMEWIINEYFTYYNQAIRMAGPLNIIEPIGVQHYAPSQGFHALHFENNFSGWDIACRHLVFMVYLNDVEDGGGTEFPYQNVTTTARKGKTIIWPAGWTHPHRGITSYKQEKMIITGYLSLNKEAWKTLPYGMNPMPTIEDIEENIERMKQNV